MKPGEMRCPRCRGQKSMYKINGGYSAANTGGVKVDCPMCLAEGVVATLEKKLEEIKLPEIKTTTLELKKEDEKKIHTEELSETKNETDETKTKKKNKKSHLDLIKKNK